MATAERSLAVAVKAAAEAARSEMDSHPNAGELIDYQEGRLPPEAERRLKDHLALCPACAETVLDLESFPFIEPRTSAPDGPLEEDGDEQVDRAWQRLRAAGVEPAQQTPSREPRPFSPEPGPARPRPFPRTLAASLLLCLAGAGFFLAGLSGPEAPGPEAWGPTPANYPQWRLLGASFSPQRATDPAREVEPPGEATGASVELIPGDPGSFEDFEVELLDADGSVLREWPGLRLREGRLTFFLPPELEPPQQGTFRLYGLDGDRRQEVDTFPFRIAPDPNP